MTTIEISITGEDGVTTHGDLTYWLMAVYDALTPEQRAKVRADVRRRTERKTAGAA